MFCRDNSSPQIDRKWYFLKTGNRNSHLTFIEPVSIPSFEPINSIEVTRNLGKMNLAHSIMEKKETLSMYCKQLLDRMLPIVNAIVVIHKNFSRCICALKNDGKIAILLERQPLEHNWPLNRWQPAS